MAMQYYTNYLLPSPSPSPYYRYQSLPQEWAYTPSSSPSPWGESYYKGVMQTLPDRYQPPVFNTEESPQQPFSPSPVVAPEVVEKAPVVSTAKATPVPVTKTELPAIVPAEPAQNKNDLSSPDLSPRDQAIALLTKRGKTFLESTLPATIKPEDLSHLESAIESNNFTETLYAAKKLIPGLDFASKLKKIPFVGNTVYNLAEKIALFLSPPQSDPFVKLIFATSPNEAKNPFKAPPVEVAPVAPKRLEPVFTTPSKAGPAADPEAEMDLDALLKALSEESSHGPSKRPASIAH
jgi:hypothetical protein